MGGRAPVGEPKLRATPASAGCLQVRSPSIAAELIGVPPRCPAAGEDIPEWFAFKSVVKVLREAIAEESSASESESS